jgi:protein-L-isoaspartate(D-aspartate) O-methyltransferase
MDSSVQDCRDFYARFIVACSDSSNERLVAAFASVARERYLGEGPWPILAGSSYIWTASADPRHVYQDVAVGLIPEKGINNGQPTLHARCLAAVDPQPGEVVVHVGAGTGYYTAVLAQLVGETGSVNAYEVDESLAERAQLGLSGLNQVHLHCENAVDAAIPASDVIYVNAGVTHVNDQWLAALRIGGRLVIPLTPNDGFGGMLLVTRKTADTYAARILARVAFIPCAGLRSDAESDALGAAFEPNSFRKVRSLRLGKAPDDSAWYVGWNWWLSTEAPEGDSTH